LREVKEKGATVSVNPAAPVVGDKADKTTTSTANNNLRLEDKAVKEEIQN
jgi:peroxiredoxin